MLPPLRELHLGNEGLNMLIGRKKTIDLCGECAEKMKDGFDVKQLPKPANNKITCGHCGRRRYGGTYEISKKKV